MVCYSVIKRPNVYEIGRAVGRQTDRPSRTDKGDFRSSDGATYDKWLQAVNGCVDFVREMTEFRSVHIERASLEYRSAACGATAYALASGL